MKKTFDDFVSGLTQIEQKLVACYTSLFETYEPETVLEVGSGWGIFSGALLHTLTEAKVTTIDKIEVKGRPDFNANTAGFEDRIERIVGDSKGVLPKLKAEGRMFDWAFVDGSHSYEDAMHDMLYAWGMIKDGGYMLVDDVFHKHNWDEEKDYGVTRALWDWANRYAQFENISIWVVGSGGLAMIHKHGEK